VARLTLTFLEYLRMIAASRREASTDSLTGMANRRQLVADLDEVLHSRRPAALALFDLDGFKLYNDTYGHPAGDALLIRLGHALDAAVAGRGRAYRMGGDEFCVVLNSRLDEQLLSACADALTEAGSGFSIKPSVGAVEVPREADTSQDALKAADQRMYEQKRGGRRSPGHQSTEVLLGVVAERDRELAEHAAGAGVLAHKVARHLGLAPEAADNVAHAAQLHDIGKVGVPDAILGKPGPLTSEELEFIRGHTLIGERIVRRAPALADVAKLVRSGHERWDGSGYPDGLAGTDIPLGARIVAVCDAFDAMVSPRPYRAGMSIEEALAELEQCAGEQFDPDVVAALTAVMTAGGEQHLAA
jgi:diguanylate cyclase (GGDEF)-like protein